MASIFIEANLASAKDPRTFHHINNQMISKLNEIFTNIQNNKSQLSSQNTICEHLTL